MTSLHPPLTAPPPPTAAPDDAGTDASSAPLLVEARRDRRRERPSGAHVPRSLRRAVGPLLLLGLWQLLSTVGVLDERTLAPPTDIADAGWDLISSGELTEHLLASLQRAGTGLGIGILVGVTLALVASTSRLGDDLLDSNLQVLRAVPILGLLPLVIIWFGVGEEAKILLVALGTTFPIYVNTAAGIRGIDAKLVETGRTFGLGRLGLARHVILPGALPNFLTGLRFALTGAWLILIVAEQINARTGIGALMNDARAFFLTDVIVFGLVVYGVLGLLSDGAVRLLERTLLGWRRGFGPS